MVFDLLDFLLSNLTRRGPYTRDGPVRTLDVSLICVYGGDILTLNIITSSSD